MTSIDFGAVRRLEMKIEEHLAKDVRLRLAAEMFIEKETRAAKKREKSSKGPRIPGSAGIIHVQIQEALLDLLENSPEKLLALLDSSGILEP